MSTETDYQSQFVSAIFNQSKADSVGMQIYKNNWIEGAHNALSISFPTVKILLGDANFRLLCRFACQSIPKKSYNWEEWSIPNTFVTVVSDFLRLQNTTGLNYVAECAKLDEMLFINQKAIDPIIKVDLLNSLGQANPDKTIFTVSKATQLGTFSFPADKVYKHAHLNEGNIAEIQQQLITPSSYFIQVSRSALSPSGVDRSEFRASISPLSRQEFILFDMVNKGHSITSLFETANDMNMDFTAWLGDAISKDVIIGSTTI
ncbi:putative DNA-binding domain-containing protein [Alteromonas sp. 5E99-2]|uniref:HvfC/BufC family peptide modification chaperone n=1 Tax=Alteromonas sp. 5E99-2 TaxID=2817683 RepID=UPI001A99C364|nr:putative DNA-binding domain-containing protein [Alteromonas sp. 5E99-2]MBO1255729.1 putative DNA-binding domain-containing protein [Alteromonas sp. 5E99-2]